MMRFRNNKPGDDFGAILYRQNILRKLETYVPVNSINHLGLKTKAVSNHTAFVYPCVALTHPIPFLGVHLILRCVEPTNRG